MCDNLAQLSWGWREPIKASAAALLFNNIGSVFHSAVFSK